MSEKSLTELIDERFDTDSQKLPVFNRVALELQKLKESRTANMQQVTNMILQDQALTSRILQIANSSFYGGLRQVDTLSEAVLRLGMNKVASLALVASQALAYRSKNKQADTRMTGLWQRAYVCARGARWIATKYGQKDQAESAFLCALLHDVGELFLLKVLDSLIQETKDASDFTITEVLMDEVLETMHNNIGYRLMRKWELPIRYATIARDHHLESFEETDALMTITRLVDQLCLKLGIGGLKPDSEIDLAASAEAQVLGLNEIQLAHLEVMVEDMVIEANAMVR